MKHRWWQKEQPHLPSPSASPSLEVSGLNEAELSQGWLCSAAKSCSNQAGCWLTWSPGLLQRAFLQVWDPPHLPDALCLLSSQCPLELSAILKFSIAMALNSKDVPIMLLSPQKFMPFLQNPQLQLPSTWNLFLAPHHVTEQLPQPTPSPAKGPHAAEEARRLQQRCWTHLHLSAGSCLLSCCLNQTAWEPRARS